MAVVVLLVAIWAVILVPPALQSHAARREAFAVSFDAPSPLVLPRAMSAESHRVRRRRRVLGGLLAAIVATGLGGLLPRLRILLVVDLFLVDSFLAYVALLAHAANRRDRPRAHGARVRRAGTGVLDELTPVAPAG